MELLGMPYPEEEIDCWGNLVWVSSVVSIRDAAEDQDGLCHRRSCVLSKHEVE